MNAFPDLAAPITWTCSGLAAVLFVAGIAETRRSLRTFGGLLLLLASATMLVALAHPLWLPARAAVVHPDGSSEDPRVLSAILLAAAALLGLLPAWRSLRLPAMASLGSAVPGLIVAGAMGSVASFAGLHLPMALAGIALGAFGATTAVVIAMRGRGSGHPSLALQAGATCLLAIGGLLALHGARAGRIVVQEGAAVDTLGQRVHFAGVDAPSSDLRVLRVTLYGKYDSLALRPRLIGNVGRNVRSVADARLFSGPIVVPMALEERRARPHEIQWVDRKTPLRSGNATIVLAGFRFVKADTIRMYADLDVTMPSGTQRVSPGLYASQKGETPFAAEAAGYGPIAVAAVDADRGRVGLMLPRLSEANVTRVAAIDLRLRPSLPVAWLGAALALVAFVLGLLGGAPAKSRA